MKYRKKPVEIEAIKWDGLNVSEIEAFCEGHARVEMNDAAWKAGVVGVHAEVFIDTLEGTHHATVGDYIIKGVHGEFYPCKPDIFAETYEAAESKPLTNFDRLRSDMEYLAQFLADLSGGDCPPDSHECKYCRLSGEPWKCWLDWLRQEAIE